MGDASPALHLWATLHLEFAIRRHRSTTFHFFVHMKLFFTGSLLNVLSQPDHKAQLQATFEIWKSGALGGPDGSLDSNWEGALLKTFRMAFDKLHHESMAFVVK